MTDLRLILTPWVRSLGNGRFRPEVRIVDPGYGTEDVFLGTHTAPSHAEALEAARRLISKATVEEPAIVEICPPVWR
jgi:hypothetical protein